MKYIVIEQKKFTAIAFRFFLLGVMATCSALLFTQDVLGLSAYIEMLTVHWVDGHWLPWAVSFFISFIYLFILTRVTGEIFTGN